MGRPKSERMMASEEFIHVTRQLAGRSESWLDRISQLTAIDKPTLLKYASGERAIANSHALFLRQMYLVQVAYPELSDDVNVLMRKPVGGAVDLPDYQAVQAASVLRQEVKRLRQVIDQMVQVGRRAIKSEGA